MAPSQDSSDKQRFRLGFPSLKMVHNLGYPGGHWHPGTRGPYPSYTSPDASSLVPGSLPIHSHPIPPPEDRGKRPALEFDAATSLKVGQLRHGMPFFFFRGFFGRVPMLFLYIRLSKKKCGFQWVDGSI